MKADLLKFFQRQKKLVTQNLNLLIGTRKNRIAKYLIAAGHNINGELETVEEILKRPIKPSDAKRLLPKSEDAKLAKLGNKHAARAAFHGAKMELDEARERLKQKKGLEKVDDDIEEFTPDELVDFSPEMQEAIGQFLSEAFGTEVWAGINEATRQQLQQAIFEALESGDSGNVLAGTIAEAFEGIFTEGQASGIANTMTTTALNGGHHTVYEELLAEGIVSGRQWVSILDGSVRESHEDADGQIANGTDDFVVGGESARFPGDPALSPGELFNCFLPGTTVEGTFIAGARSFYCGQAIEIKTAGGRIVRVTQNHPVLTEDGFISARLLKKGVNLIGSVANGKFSASSKSGNYDKPISVEKVFDSFASIGQRKLIRAASDDFHGDGRFVQGDIDIVKPNASLLNNFMSTRKQVVGDLLLPHGDMSFAHTASFGSLKFFADRMDSTANRFPCCAELSLRQFRIFANSRPLYGFCLGSASQFNTGLMESRSQDSSGNAGSVGNGFERFASSVALNQFINVVDGEPALKSASSGCLLTAANRNTRSSQGVQDNNVRGVELLSQLDARFSTFIERDKIVSVRKFQWMGHVYDLQSPFGWISAGGLIQKNCRCTTIDVYPEE